MTPERREILIAEILVTTIYNRLEKYGYDPADHMLSEFNNMWLEKNPNQAPATLADVVRSQCIVAEANGELDKIRGTVSPELWAEVMGQ